MVTIVSADTEPLVQQLLGVAQEFVTWMTSAVREHYPELPLTELTSEHDYDDMSKKFPGEHVPPHGRILLAMHSDSVAGCIALGKMSDGVCEMRTLYVRPAYRGRGVAKQLVDALIDEARAIGYTYMRLDTLGFMQNAHQIYRSVGFYDIAPYRDISDTLQQYMCFLELDLRK